jgi:hypothetical protein
LFLLATVYLHYVALACTLCCGQMGQSSASPMNLVTWIDSLVLSWGENSRARTLQGWTAWQIYDTDLEVRAAARLAPDYDASDGARDLEIRFQRRRQGRHRERYLYVRFAATQRRLDIPRAWKTLGRLPRSRIRRRHRRLGIVGLSRVIYWSEMLPREDVRAQILIALVQLELVSDGTVVHELFKYVRSFRRDVSSDAAWDVASELLQYWSYPEDYRAFRKYVSIRLQLRLRQFQVLPAKEAPIRMEELYQQTRDAESRFESNDKQGDLDDSGKSTTSPWLRITDRISVQDTALILGISPSYVYKLIKRMALRKTACDRKVEIRKEDIHHISERLAAKKVRQQRQRELIDAGAKYGTARKRIYRRFGPLPHV